MEEAIKKLEFKQEVGGTEACVKIIMKDTKGSGQLSTNDTCFSGSWFGGVKKYEEASTEGVYYCGLVQTCHKGF